MEEGEIRSFPRSFSLLEEHLRGENYNPAELLKWAYYLLPHQLEGEDRNKSISRRFFETHGLKIAGPCGCSRLFFDHMRLDVPRDMQKDLILEFSDLYSQGYFPKTHPGILAYMMTVVYKMDYTESSLASLIRANVYT